MLIMIKSNRIKIFRNRVSLKVKEARPFWVFMFVLIFALALPLLLRLPNPFSYSSIFLELLALIVFVKGLNKIQIHFTGKGFLDNIYKWFRGLFKKSDVTVMPASSGSYNTVSGGDIFAKKRDDLDLPNTKLEEKVEKLILNVKEIDKDLNKLRAIISKNKKEFKKSINQLESRLNIKIIEIEKLVSKLDKKVEDVQFSGLHYELVGFGWLIIAVLLELPFIDRTLNTLVCFLG